jgi:nicotinamidase-related amidase
LGNIALLIIDMQIGNFPESGGIVAGETLVKRVSNLVSKAHDADVPVIFVKNNGGPDEVDFPGTPGWEIHPNLGLEATDIVVEKKTPDSFHETDLQSHLQKLNVTCLVIAGLQTEYCVDTTCRRASTLGFDVTLVSDAHGTWNSSLFTADQIIAHHNSVLSGFFVSLESESKIEF